MTAESQQHRGATVAQFRKKPVVIEAYQFTQAIIEAHLFDKQELPLPVRLAYANYHPVNRTISRSKFIIDTLEGKMEVSLGDWVIKGVKGEFYPCKPEIFEATYDKVEP